MSNTILELQELFTLNPLVTAFQLHEEIDNCLDELIFLESSLSALCFDEDGELIASTDILAQGLRMISNSLEKAKLLSKARFKKEREKRKFIQKSLAFSIKMAITLLPNNLNEQVITIALAAFLLHSAYI